MIIISSTAKILVEGLYPVFNLTSIQEFGCDSGDDVVFCDW